MKVLKLSPAPRVWQRQGLWNWLSSEQLLALALVTNPMGWLAVRSVKRAGFGGWVSELSPSRNRDDLIDLKAHWMTKWQGIINRGSAQSAWVPSFLDGFPQLSSSRPVCITRVAFARHTPPGINKKGQPFCGRPLMRTIARYQLSTKRLRYSPMFGQGNALGME